jgi:hypothetical protein
MADSSEDPRLAVIRARLIRLLDEAEYRITRRALEEGLRILKDWEVTPTEWGLVEFILRKLRGGHPLREALQGDPPGSHGVAYELKQSDERGLYIKMTIVEQAFDRELVVVISFHY